MIELVKVYDWVEWIETINHCQRWPKVIFFFCEHLVDNLSTDKQSYILDQITKIDKNIYLSFLLMISDGKEFLF